MFIAAKRSVTRPPPGGPWSLDFFCPESHQRSWWIVHTQPTKRAGHTPGPKSHQRSWWIVHTQPTKRAGHTPGPKSHQRSLWIGHNEITKCWVERFGSKYCQVM